MTSLRSSPSGPLVEGGVLIELLGWTAGVGNNLALELLPSGHAPGLYMVFHSYTFRVAESSANFLDFGLTWSAANQAQSALPVGLTFGSAASNNVVGFSRHRPASLSAVPGQNFPRPPMVLYSNGTAAIVLTATFSVTLASPGIDVYASVQQVA